MTNCYLLWDPDSLEAVVVDPGDVSEDLLAMVGSNGLRVTWIVNTHAHVDHAAGNKRLQEFTGAGLALHPKDKDLLEHLDVQARMFLYPCEPSPEPSRWLKEAETLSVGAFSLKVLETPGHSPGSVSLLGEGFVVVGDALFAGSIGRTDLPGGSFETLIASIQEKLLVLEDDIVVLPGHGPETRIGRERRFNPFL